MLSEAEAKTKWCPFAIAAHWNSPTGGNRLMRNNPPSNQSPVAVVCHCIASGCMAWRWDILPMEGAPDQDIAAKRGHCGLAGASS